MTYLVDELCANLDIGADILDSTGQNTFNFGRLQEEKTWFELDSSQKNHLEAVQAFNSYLREEYHAVQVIKTLINR